MSKHVNAKWRFFLASLANIFYVFFFIAIILGSVFIAINLGGIPKLDSKHLETGTPSKIYDKDGQLIAILGQERQEVATVDEIPIDLVNAITSIEDQRFFDHKGVDIVRVFGAFFNNISNDTTQGGSTLDQQLIKMSYFSSSEQDKNIKRKIQELLLSIKLDRTYTKSEILTFYVNKVYMANGVYGMKTASESYYGKPLKDLTIAQCALLAGIPQAPSQYDPYLYPEAAKERRDLVLKMMLHQKHITKDQYHKAKDTPITDGLKELSITPAYPKYMDNYLTQVIKETKEKTGINLLSTGVDVYTNVDAEAQKRLWDIYNSDTYVSYPDDQLQVASTVVDVDSGRVIAQLGARKQTAQSSLGTNQAVETNRDFGSTNKPITDYAPAFEYGVYNSTADRVSDSPYYFPGSYTPVYNWDRSYMGSITVQDAIKYSRNVPAVRSLEKTGLDKAQSFLKSIGIDYPELTFPNAISSNTTDSGSQYGVSSEKMAAAYASFANGGTYYKPQYVNRIILSDGTDTEYSPDGKRVMSEETAFMMTAMMKSVLTYGIGAQAAVPGVPMAGKTGTSNYDDNRYDAVVASNPQVRYSSIVAPDECFAGYTKKYAMAVWTGYTNRNIPITDSTINIASHVFKQMMTYLNPVNETADWQMPAGLTGSGGYYYRKANTSKASSKSSSPSSTSSSQSQASNTSSSQASQDDTTQTTANPNPASIQPSSQQHN